MLPNTRNKSDSSCFKNCGMMRIEACEKECDPESLINELKLREEELYHEIEKMHGVESGYPVAFRENYYEYRGLDKLDTSELVIENFAANIHICPFQVNTMGKVPFLQFFMRKHASNPDKFTFMTFVHDYEIDSIVKAQNIIDISLMSYNKIAYNKYAGFFHDESKSEYYLFFDCTHCEIDVHNLHRANELWLLTIDELVNTRVVCGNFHVDSSVTNFFLENPEFIYLQDKNKENYDIPAIVYVGTDASKSNYVSTFGQGQSDANAIFGPHYYFYDYTDAVKMAMDKYIDEPEKKKPLLTIMNFLNKESFDGISVTRFALFLGRTKIIENVRTNDTSRTTLDMLNEDPTRATKKHRELINYLTISDRESSWTENYDSVFLGEKLVLEDETIGCHFNTYVVKDYAQQLPLSCHFLNAKQETTELSSIL